MNEYTRGGVPLHAAFTCTLVIYYIICSFLSSCARPFLFPGVMQEQRIRPRTEIFQH